MEIKNEDWLIFASINPINQARPTLPPQITCLPPHRPACRDTQQRDLPSRLDVLCLVADRDKE
ncbi:hypothetical protein E2C01_064558 [Portunus trituberculatus]|uniref:Uncharacterized protein n=1 Tax=Portunus trituberculatus TaxID=210409 RepID=A0A5B7HP37_PORTR|nr:hypothetical protein [Portunus trituberculatus]